MCVGRVVESEGGVLGGYIVERRERSMVLVFCILKVMKKRLSCLWREEEKERVEVKCLFKKSHSPTLHTHTFPLPLHTAPPSPLQRHRTDS